MTEQLNIILVPHTHWDREWYQTFQQFRIRLVKAVDRLLDILDRDDDFRYFMLDGQTIVLDDYLEVRPEQEERLKQYIRAGRILVGPWYLQPDEFLVSGESLIRNLQRGLRQARAYGQPMRIGYVPDIFGHIAQLPQILQGADIDTAVLWRGVGEEVHNSEFCWAAPDGSEVLVIHLADALGYSNASQMPLSAEEFVTRVKLLAANILPKATTDTLLFMNGSDHQEPQKGLPEVIKAANALMKHVDLQPAQTQAERHRDSENRGHNGGHNGAHYDSIQVRIGTLADYIERVRRQETHFETLSGELRSSQYAHLLPAVLSTRMWIKQKNTEIEHLLERWVEPLTAWAAQLGASYPQGLVDLAWKYLLQNQPHDSICGCSIDQVHRENSVRFAQSQQIGESVVAQAMQDIVAVTDTRAPFPAPHPTDEPVPIVVFNPAPGPRTARAQVVVQLPGSLHNALIVDERGQSVPYRVVNRWRQEVTSFSVPRTALASGVALAEISSPEQLIQMAQTMMASTLSEGEETHVISHIYIEGYNEPPIHLLHHASQPGVVAVEIMLAPKGRIAVNEKEVTASGGHILALMEREDIHTLEVVLVDQARETVDFLATDLPAYGFKTFWLYPRGLKEGIHEQSADGARPSSGQYALRTHERTIENEFYRVEASAQDGTITVTDKQTGVVFAGLNRFIDGGDIGDLYTYCPPEHDTLISEPQEAPKIELVRTGPVQAMLRISARWALPGACTVNRSERSSRLTTCSIVSEVSLTPGVRRVDIHTSVENKVKDHRLRVIFPVLYKVEQASAEGTFEVRNRPIAQPRPDDVSQWAEEPVNTFPQKRFVDLSDGKTGLAVLNRGLPEYEILQSGPMLAEGQMAIALTLLRCVEWLSRGDLPNRHGHAGPMEHTPEAQCPGHHEFDYALVPHAGTWEAEGALVLREAQSFNIPVTTRTVVTEQHAGQLASRSTLVEVEPRELVVSAIKRSGRGLLVRVYNPQAHTVDATIRPMLAFSRAYMANLLEERQEPVPGSTMQPVQVNIRGGSIMTLVFE
jgi:mannosylglycerate hydrolase